MKPLKALLVEDSEIDGELLLRQLAAAGYDVQSMRVRTAADLEKALDERDWDVVLSDFTMPGFTGLDALRILRESRQDIPLIIISGTIDEGVAVEAMRSGVSDYLLKGNLARLAPAIEREMKNSARFRAQKQAEESLRLSEKNLADAQRIAHIGSWETDLVNNRLFWSDEVYRIFGVSKDDFGATLEAFISFIHPDDRKSVQDAADAALAQKASYNIEHRIITESGVEKIVCEIGEVTFDQAGMPVRMIGTVQDITERKRIEEALENAAKREAAMIENALDVICSTDAEGKFVTVSPASLKVWGYRPEELIGQHSSQLVVPEDLAKTEEVVAEIVSGIPARGFENRCRHKNGSMVHIRWTALWSETDQLTFCVAHDITERKRAEEEKMLLAAQIEHQHERLNNIVANVPGVVWEAWGRPDAATQRIDFVSDYVETMLGYSVEDWITTPNFWLSIVHPEDKERIAREATEKFQAGEGYTKQFRWIAKDGRIVWVETQATVIRDEAGQPIGLRGINIDITERRRLEDERTKLAAELAFEKARLQHIFEHIPAFIVVLRGPDLVFEMANPAYYPIVDHREVIGLPLRDALPELEGQGFFELIGNVYNTGEVFTGNELSVQLLAPNGSKREQRYVNLMYMPLRDADDSISGVLSYGMDVTEQVMSRIKTQESEERYRFLFDNNPLPMWVFDLETLRFLSVNEAAIKHYGYSEEEFLSMTLKDIRLPEDISELFNIAANYTSGIKNVGVVRHRKKDGTFIYAEIILNQLIFNGRKAQLVLANDVTERRKAEESVSFQAHLLNTVEQSVVATDLNGIITYWNQFSEKLYGWTNAEIVGRNILELTAPEINGKQTDRVMARLRAGKSWAGEYTVRNKTEEIFPAYAGCSPVSDASGKMVGIVGVSVDITERKNAEAALRQTEEKYRRLVESSPAVVYLAEPHPPFSPIYVSPNIAKFGYAVDEWFNRADMWISLIHPEDRDRVLRLVTNALQQGLDTDLEYRIIAGDGTIHWLQDRGQLISDGQGNRTGWQGVMLDITGTKALEEQLRQSQKLESIGRLAGGIAHDFNNMLTAINGYSELTLRKLEADSPLREDIEEIKKAGNRSALLTHQLLAFSRQQVLKPVVINPNDVITETINLLRRLIGEDIKLVIALNSKTGLVNADPGQLSQIIMNLAVNARDAMPRGGQLIIETANVFLEPADVEQKLGILPGAYVMIAVCDTGQGIDDKIRQQIFEPFFTTKELGEGTGLGLATVYGIVKQSGGNIEFESQMGIGTTFRIYLPRVAERPAASETIGNPAELLVGTETILLVEDEDLVRKATKKILETCGYKVIEARDGMEALKIFDAGDCNPELLMTDVVMPQMSGRRLAEKLTLILPGIKILFTSGYMDDAVILHDVIENNTNFIQKPFTPDALANKIREVLDNP